MSAASSILQPFIDAPSLSEAEEELDRLAGGTADLPVPLGDLYDELAEAAAEDDQYGLAARLEAKAIANGCRHRDVARQMHGWYQLKAGATEAGEATFSALCAERPDDPELRITMGHARSDAGLQAAALAAFDDALAIAKRRGYRREIDRARSERREEREEAGLELDEDDDRAPAPGP